MSVSAKKRISNDRYSAKCDRFNIRPLFPLARAIRSAADASGQSLQSYVLQACKERMTREGQPLELPEEPAETGET